MTPQDYIESGILEAYALGAATPEEQREVELFCTQHPEVRTALEQAQQALEKYATLHAVEPSEKIREKIFEKISVPASTAATQGKIISIQPPLKNPWRRFAAAASLLLLLSIGFNIFYWMRIGKMENQFVNIDSLAQQYKLQIAQNESALKKMQTDYNHLASISNIPRDTMNRMIMLNGTKDAPHAMAVVYWHKMTKTVYIDPMNLPTPPKDKQYELWAIVDGKPVKAGMFMVNENTGMQMIRTIPEAQAFAVTLEQMGGVDQPQGPMVVMGQMAVVKP